MDKEAIIKDSSASTSSLLKQGHSLLENILNLTTNNLYLCSKLFKNNQKNKAKNVLSKSIEDIENLLQLVRLMSQNIKSLSEDKEFKDIYHNLQIHLLSVLKALLLAQENNDLIMLCDLIEYEIVDNLMQWKIRILPKLKI